MLERVGAVARHDLRQIAHRAQRFAVDAHPAKRRGERFGARHREPAHRHAVHRTKQHHAAYHAARGRELVVSMRGHPARIDVAGVRHDERLGKAQARR